MSEGLRWKIVVGCLLLVILEAPDSALVLAQDLEGPWRARATAVHSVVADPPVAATPSIQLALNSNLAHADASLAVENLLDLDRNPPTGSASRNLQVLAAR